MTLILLILLGAAAFFIVISSLVFFHELGHYSVARMFGIAVERFSIGFGKPLWRRRAKSGTEWVIAAIPLGGYVKFLGDSGAASNPDAEQLAQIKSDIDQKYGEETSGKVFHFKPLWQRVLVVLAGPIANFILAAVIFTGFILMNGRTDYHSYVADLVPGEAAEAAGFLPGDLILTFNGQPAATQNKLLPLIALHADTDIVMDVKRNGEIKQIEVRLLRIDGKDFVGGDAEKGRLGIAPSRIDEHKIITTYSLPGAMVEGTKEVGSVIGHTGTYIKRIFTGQESGKQLGGIVRIAAMTGKTATDGAQSDRPVSERISGVIQALIYLAGAFSIGLGVANLMPIPVLDGGHLLFYGYEAVAGRPLSQKTQEIGFRMGFALILGLFVILTWNDIGYVRSLF
ncbi:M50 family metallopeptidase [Robiginitomaculum antarcticum]|uniref:M50 family metallopeptidase n=1 Tax=Robiginitomaculum antarcticum TaxID=437507 RepID=UPI0003623BF0|nr:RIP metalloprotease [Robiginitomaculum antarcticum]